MDNEAHLIELAQQKRLLTKKQARIVMSILAESTGARAGNIMLEKHYVTEEQLHALRREGGGMAYSDADTQQQQGHYYDPGPDSGPQQSPPGPPQEYAQPSVRDLQRQQTAGPDPQQMPSQDEGSPEPEPAPSPAVSSEPPTTPKPPAPVDVDELPDRIPEEEGKKQLARLLKIARHWNASDLHITVGRPPIVRLGGALVEMEEPPLSPGDTETLAMAGLRPAQEEEARKHYQFDFSLEIPKLGRHRCSIFNHRLGWDAAFRIIPAEIPTIEQLGLPDTVRQFTEYHQGLVMITGSGGAGKTTTAAALLDLVNANRDDHIITVEDPVEYILSPRRCQVMQREIGRHTQSFANALRAALREDPDILLIGELRDLNTTAISISAAETGHLVFATMNTSSAMRTVSKIVDFYPSSQQSQVQTMVAESLRGVITQQLVPRADGEGVVLATEIMVNTSGIATQIKDGKTQMLVSLIQGGKKQGMRLMDESLMNLLQQNLISGEEAYQRAANKKNFEIHRGS